MNRYFPVYAAILGILALLLFLSPQISAFISADTTTQGAEILKNINFKQDSFDDRTWTLSLQDKTNTVKFTSNALQIDNTLSRDNFSLVAQRLTLSKDKMYELNLDYDWQNSESVEDVASFGIMKRGLNSELALVYPISNTLTSTKIKKYFAGDNSFLDPYLYILVEGTGSFRVNSISLKEYDGLPDGAAIDDTTNGQILPIRIIAPLSAPSAAAVTQTPIHLASPTTVSTQTSALPISNSSPTKSATAAATLTNSGDRILAYPGWNVSYSNDDISSDLFTKQGLSVFQMLGGSWYKASQNSEGFILTKQAAIYIYNPVGESKSISLVKSDSPSALSPDKRWNLLVNSTDQEIKSNSDFELNGATAKIAELIKEKKISSEIYVLSSTVTGVLMKKIDPTKESIPPKTAFWLFLQVVKI